MNNLTKIVMLGLLAALAAAPAASAVGIWVFTSAGADCQVTAGNPAGADCMIIAAACVGAGGTVHCAAQVETPIGSPEIDVDDL